MSSKTWISALNEDKAFKSARDRKKHQEMDEKEGETTLATQEQSLQCDSSCFWILHPTFCAEVDRRQGDLQLGALLTWNSYRMHHLSVGHLEIGKLKWAWCQDGYQMKEFCLRNAGAEVVLIYAFLCL